MGCRRWFLAVRDTRTNAVAHTFWPPRAADPEPTEGPPAKPAEP